jgi:hypothetical protein
MEQLVRPATAGLVASLFAVTLAARADAYRSAVEHVVAPGGKTVYYIMSVPGKDAAGNQNLQIEVRTNDKNTVLLANIPVDNPMENLTGFAKLMLSPAAKTLFFETDAWARRPLFTPSTSRPNEQPV